MNHVKILNSDMLEITLSNFISNISEINTSVNCVYQHNDDTLISNNKFNMLDKLKFNSKSLDLLQEIMMESLIKCESSCPGSGKIYLQLFTDILVESKLNTINYDDLFNKIVDLINESTEFIKSNDMKKYLTSIINDYKLVNMIFESLNFTGITGKIHVDFTPYDKDTIELIEGFTFNIKSLNDFSNLSEIKRSLPKVLIIDGIIEKISEIDHILRKANETNDTILICAIGFSEEVILTLRLNFLNKKLDVIPIAVGVDQNTINMLKDIAIVCNTRYVSAMTGDVISTVKYDELNTVEDVVISGNSLRIKNSTNKNNISNHISQLINKKTSINNFLSSKLYDERIKSLASKYVNVKIGAMNDQEKLIKLEKIHTCLKLIPILSRYGIIKSNDKLYDKVLNLKQKSIIKLFKNQICNEFISPYVLLYVIKHVFDTIKLIKNIDCMIISEN
jgi:hypothetical protein